MEPDCSIFCPYHCTPEHIGDGFCDDGAFQGDDPSYPDCRTCPFFYLEDVFDRGDCITASTHGIHIETSTISSYLRSDSWPKCRTSGAISRRYPLLNQFQTYPKKQAKNMNETSSNLSLGTRLTRVKRLSRKRCCDTTPDRFQEGSRLTILFHIS